MKQVGWFCAISLLCCCSFESSNGQIEEEKCNLKPYPEEVKSVIGRGLVGLPTGQNEVFLSWRLLPNESAKIPVGTSKTFVAISLIEYKMPI